VLPPVLLVRALAARSAPLAEPPARQPEATELWVEPQRRELRAADAAAMYSCARGG